MWLTLEVTQPRATDWSEAGSPRRLATVSPAAPAGAAGAHRSCRRSGSYRRRRGLADPRRIRNAGPSIAGRVC
ncbi:hypothetical protein LNP25_23285 [Klebsiella variicola subsp. variicola]|nr:hypothetical protein [Klebsiella variicola subsp. variicola]